MTTYLAIDLGTTGCRSILYDASLRELAISYEEYPLQTPQEHWAEQDAEDWWRLTCSTAKNAIRQAGCSAAEVHALSISSQGITLVPVDTLYASEDPLAPGKTAGDLGKDVQAADADGLSADEADGPLRDRSFDGFRYAAVRSQKRLLEQASSGTLSDPVSPAA